MNRRMALFLTMMAGGLAPRYVLAQSRGGKSTDGDRGRRARVGARRIARRPDAEEAEEIPGPDEKEKDEPVDIPAEVQDQPGHRRREWDIARYTALAPNQARPQAALIEWIFRRTGSAEWHGEKVAMLGANRAKLWAYQSPKVLDQVNEVVERFIDAQDDVLKVRVRFVAVDSPKWRYAVFSRLTPLGSGPQGQQIWTAKAEDVALVLTQLGVNGGGKPLTDQVVKMVNGQTLSIVTTESRDYVAGLQRTGAVGLGFYPGTQKLEEGIVLRMSPLLTYEGDAIDVAVDLKANTVKSLHRTKVIAPVEVGPAEMTIDVPEVAETRLNQTVKGWPLNRTLIITGGIQPGILQAKTGPLNLKIPGTYPTTTELLVLIDAEVVNAPAPRPSRTRD